MPHGRYIGPRVIASGAAAALVLSVIGIYAAAHRGEVSTDDAQVDGHVSPVAARISGTIIEVRVDDGHRVRAGDVLARIDPREYDARVEQARAALGAAEQQARGAVINVPLTAAATTAAIASAGAVVAASRGELSQAGAWFEQASTSELAAARARVAQLAAAADKARNDLARMQPLAEKAEISRQEFDAYQAGASEAAAALDAGRQEVLAAEQVAQARRAAVAAAEAHVSAASAAQRQAEASGRQVDISAAAAAAARANVSQARAALLAAELQASYTTITAPVSGYVTGRTVERGQVVGPGQGLLTIAPEDDLWITANFKETQLGRLRPGQRATVRLDVTGEDYPARVESIGAVSGEKLSLLPPENATGNYVKVVQRVPVRIRLDRGHAPASALRPGVSAEVTVHTR
ncbi:RND transporter [Luteitalea sp. TBR-22]|uniref:HlyD family secretion protein n=1 Tax=Luteitalea sp. TBR-22 TaxID=2802971 RepID=UPI001AF1683D|nr:HlyD family secretion protein [Luteitalea sp. TBR-22]BCS35046.1 RND transporter [Luteitalea sp. TBR-22]